MLTLIQFPWSPFCITIRRILEHHRIPHRVKNMLSRSSFLIGERRLFVDYDLYGVIANYLYSGKTNLPALKHLRRWYQQMQITALTNHTPTAPAANRPTPAGKR